MRQSCCARNWNQPRWNPQTLVMSGVTDPYQPIERKLCITRGCLEVLARFRNPVAIITKNRLVTRDVDLLRSLAAHNAVAVNISVTSLDSNLQRVLEPRTSSPQARLDAIRQLRSAGIPTGVMVAPIIPGLTDHEVPKDPRRLRKSRCAICRVHNRPPAVGCGATIRTLARGTFSRAQREGAGTHPRPAAEPAK